MKFTVTQVDKLRMQFARYRENNKIRENEPLSIELVLAEMEECSSVPRAFFEGRERKALNNKLWRFAKGSRPEDEALFAIQEFISSSSAEGEGDFEEDQEMRIVHGFLANGSPQARRAFNEIQDGAYVARRFSGSDEIIVLNFQCDRAEMIVRVEEVICREDIRQGPDGRLITKKERRPVRRKGYGFLSTEKILLHIFLIGDHARDRVHYVEVGSLASDGHPYLMRIGGADEEARKTRPPNLPEITDREVMRIFDVMHFDSSTLLKKEAEKYKNSPSPLPDHMLRFGGINPKLAWGIVPNGSPFTPDGLARELIDAVKANSFQQTKVLLARNVNPNFQDEDGMTCLHHAAARACRSALRLLIASGKCDYLIPDNYGRYPSDLAIEWGRDYPAARLLTKKRLRQASAQGVSSRR